MTKKPQSPATPPGVPDPTFHHPTNNPTRAKWEQHDSTTTTHKTTATASLVKKVKKLNRTNTHNAKQTARKTNDTTGMLIIDDTIKEYECAYIRMRSYEIRAARDNFNELSVNKFTLHPTEFLTGDEMNTINNELRNETRRNNWLNEARAQLILHRQYQDVPYDQTQEDTWTLDTHEEQTRKMERCDAIRLKHLPTHSKEEATRNFNILYTAIAFRTKKLASENMEHGDICISRREQGPREPSTRDGRKEGNTEVRTSTGNYCTGWRTPTEHY
jgi:hypothetical protein